MFLRKLFTHSGVILIIVLYSNFARSAEFMESNLYPTFASIVLTERSVAVAVNHNHFHQSRSDEHQRFFAADRSDYRFRLITEEQFSELMRFDHYIRRTERYRGGVSSKPTWMASSPFCSDEYAPKAKRAPIFAFGESTVEVKLACKSIVSDANFFNYELWITTFRSTEFFDGRAEGLVIASQLDGKIKSRVDVGRTAARAIVRDPWSSDTWILTDHRITVVNEDHTIKVWREPVHGFDHTAERPDVLLPSEPRTTIDPLAIIAYSLGEQHYQAFYQKIKNTTFVPEEGLLYRFFYGNWHYQPLLPPELSSLLSDAQPTRVWRLFACVLEGKRAKELCRTPVEEWPNLAH